ncbi:MAG: UDP-glucose 4-epimerase GalE [Bacteroidota bacterium]
MNILVTGGAGFIGSHTIVELQKAGYQSIILDNFTNSEKSVLQGLETIIGSKIVCYEGNCGDAAILNKIFSEQKIDGVIHFAASKAVGESVENPLKYYHNNVSATVTLLELMLVNKVSNLVFSSSCTVYGEPDALPVTENTPVKPANSPYGNTKQICEEIIRDTVKANQIKAISLRYFNPIGAHESAIIGELPKGTPANLVPFVTQVGIGQRAELQVFGDDYDTVDGTCVRDYIHVVDLAAAHVAAVDLLVKNSDLKYYDTFNIGTGRGNTVLEVIRTFEEISGNALNYRIMPRREGDVTAVYADVTKAEKELGWSAKKSLKESLTDAWRWQKKICS